VASADELIREAQYAFRNISHGSTDERKYKARAEKYARRTIRKYPASVEASQARRILAQLNPQMPVPSKPVEPPRSAAADFKKSHSANSGHTTNLSRPPVSFDAALQQSGMAEDWRNLIRRFVALPPGKKKTIGIVVFFAIVFFFPIGLFIVSGLVIFYALQTALLKKHLGQLLNKLESK
jgi:hypothetical protein